MTIDIPGVYVKAFAIAGVVVPVFLHLANSKAMPWWPDTASLAIVFGVTAVLVVSRQRKEREMNRRLWMVLTGLGRRVLPRIRYVPPGASVDRGEPVSRLERPAPKRHRPT